MAITTRFLRDIRESAEGDLPTHPSDAANELPDSLGGKVGARAIKGAHDGVKAVNDTSAVAAGKKKTVAKEEKEDELDEGAESDLPTHASAAGQQIPDKLSEEEDEDEKHEVSEEEDEDEKKAVAESEDEDEDEKKAVAESDEDEDDDSALHEEEDEDEKKAVAESEDEDETVEESDAHLSKDDEEKLSEEEDEEVKEAADALTKDEELPESFKRKVSSIFEAAVKRTAKKRVDAHKKKLVENYNNKLSTSKKQISETLVNKVDGYLDYVVEEWMKDNRVAVEGALRSEITEKFITGLKNLFESHYIEVPAEKANIVSTQEQKIKTLEKELNDELVKSVELRKENIQLRKSAIVKKLTEGLTVSDSAKFVELCEGVSFEDAKSFGQKLKVIKETYFPKTPKSSGDIDASLLIEGGLKHNEESPKTVTAADIYAQTISRLVKK
jgi:ribosomal protein S17E